MVYIGISNSPSNITVSNSGLYSYENSIFKAQKIYHNYSKLQNSNMTVFRLKNKENISSLMANLVSNTPNGIINSTKNIDKSPNQPPLLEYEEPVANKSASTDSC